MCEEVLEKWRASGVRSEWKGLYEEALDVWRRGVDSNKRNKTLARPRSEKSL